jgi:hypothetical protein
MDLSFARNLLALKGAAELHPAAPFRANYQLTSTPKPMARAFSKASAAAAAS